VTAPPAFGVTIVADCNGVVAADIVEAWCGAARCSPTHRLPERRGDPVRQAKRLL